MRRHWICAACLALLAGAAATSGASAAATRGTTARTITVNGTGIVTTVPDQAEFTFGVSVTATTAKTALAANARRMNSLIAAIEKQGIAERDIQTAEISLSPNTNDNGTKILDFTASNSVTVMTKAISKAGAIVDAAVAAGANTISGPTLTPSGQLGLERRALAAAVADARARALAIAAASHVKLGAVRTVTETSSSPVTYSPAPKEAAAAASTPVEAGTVQTEEDVTVTFAIA
ncbi:MAG TPA: SIMPL domain-containing protein [Gaiellaceae bacterium]|jgi:hypothetical protein|nr:SIMPL domain-containing protein [Gaiellaceae bacterium]